MEVLSQVANIGTFLIAVGSFCVLIVLVIGALFRGGSVRVPFLFGKEIKIGIPKPQDPLVQSRRKSPLRTALILLAAICASGYTAAYTALHGRVTHSVVAETYSIYLDWDRCSPFPCWLIAPILEGTWEGTVSFDGYHPPSRKVRFRFYRDWGRDEGTYEAEDIDTDGMPHYRFDPGEWHQEGTFVLWRSSSRTFYAGWHSLGTISGATENPHGEFELHRVR